MKLTLDIETFSRCDLKRHGMARYAEDESTDINCACWAIDDGPVSAWIPQADMDFLHALQPLYNWGSLYAGPETPKELLMSIVDRRDEVHAWKADFERSVLKGPAGQRYLFPEIQLSQVFCSMVNARVHGLPGALEDAANAVNASVKKRIGGVNAMRYLAKPRSDGTRPMLIEERERFLQLIPYCADDVAAERAVDSIVPRMSDAELRIYRELDQPMNEYGWKVDLESVDNMEVLVQLYKKELEQRCREICRIKPSRAGPLAEWIRDHGVPHLENLQADTVRKVLLKGGLPPETEKVMKIYSTFGMKAVAKYPAMRKSVTADDRLKYLFGMYGAGTGRWVSYIVQLQNLFRPVIDDPEMAIEIAREWDLQYLRDMYPGHDPMKVIASCVRSCLIADKGKELIFPDYSGVEARKNAWLWGEEWELEAYRDYDKGIGPNVYIANYARSYGMDPRSPEAIAGKQLGKVLVLSMGYEGGVGAFVKMAATYRVDLKDLAEKTLPTLPRDVMDEAVDAHAYASEQGRIYELPDKIWIACEGLKILWRRAHPKIVKGWEALKYASIEAVENPGRAVPAGKFIFKVEGDWMIKRLPSGRRLWYYKPNVREKGRGRELHYLGMNTVTRMWGPTSTYGGKLNENGTQGSCRDLLVRAKYAVRDMGLPLVGSVHDEPVAEVDEGWDGEAELTKRMCTNGKWDTGLPLAVEFHRGKRYRK